MDAAGDFAVVWRQDSGRVQARRFTADRVAGGDPFFVDASDPAGNFIVAWTHANPSLDGSAVLARSFTGPWNPASGLAEKLALRRFQWRSVGDRDIGRRVFCVASEPAGHFAVTWAQTGRTSADVVRMLIQARLYDGP